MARACLLVLLCFPAFPAAADRPFVIAVVDGQTGRGVPLVELEAGNQRRWYTDSNGIAAISDAWLFGQDVFFAVRSHGYVFDEKVFEDRGKVLHVTEGGRVQLRIHRENIAERLYRITGAGIYADSVAAGVPAPIKNPLLNGKVTGQDTAIAIPYHGRIYWFWGDTFGPANANFNVAGATSAPPAAGGLDPDRGVDLTYFVDQSGFSKPMLPLDRPGLVWLEGLMTVRGPQGRERLAAIYTRQHGLGAADERGIALFDDAESVFRVLARFPSTRSHRSSHPVRFSDGGRAYWYLYPNYRVPDDWNAIQDAHAYEAYTCDKEAGSTRCGWKRGEPVAPEGALFPLIDVDASRPSQSGVGSIAWNAYRKKWILIGDRLGDVYYSEADAPEGPWRCAKRIVRHEKYNFYNVVHHPFFDTDSGRVIYFEGTYTTAFIDGAQPTPLYDYNQVMYKLSLDDARLRLPASCAMAQEPEANDLLTGRWTRLKNELASRSGIAFQKAGSPSQLILAGAVTSYWLDLEKRQFRRFRAKLPWDKDEFEASPTEAETPANACALVRKIPGTAKFASGMTYVGVQVTILDGRNRHGWVITRFAESADDPKEAAGFTIGTCPSLDPPATRSETPKVSSLTASQVLAEAQTQAAGQHKVIFLLFWASW